MQQRWKMKHVLTSLVVAGLLSANTGFAQNTNSADLRGSVTDANGALIPTATVTVKDVDKGTERIFTTDKAGMYETGSIVSDHYLVTIAAPGFRTLVRGPINLDVGQATLDAQLSVGAVTEKVVVTTELPLLDSSDGSQTDTLSGATMAQLPQYGADWENFVTLLPGSSFSYRSGQSTSINGNLPYSSALSDGATTTLPTSTNSDVTVFETTAEVKVDANSLSAQYGIGGIIFNQITKGGTDHFHGSAYEYLQNTALNAADYAFCHANGRTNLQAPVWNRFMPRIGASWSVRPNTVIRGGFGLYNYTWSDDTYGGGIGNAFGSAGGQFDNSGGSYPVLLLDSDGSINYQGGYGKSKQQLYVAAPTTPQANNGNGLTYNMYHAPVPKIWQYNLTVQHQLGSTMMFSATYVGSHGYNLNFPVDINQVPQSQLSVTVCNYGPSNCDERPFTPVMASSQSYAQAGNQFPNLIGNPFSLVAPNNTGDKSNGGAQSTIHDPHD